MKKMIFYLLMVVILFSFPPLASSLCCDCVGRYKIEDTIALDSVITALESAVGEKMVSMIEDKGGELDVASVRRVTSSQEEVFLIPAGENEMSRFNILYIKRGKMDPFWAVMESPKEIYNLLNTYAIYLPSGEVLSFERFGTKTISDIELSDNGVYCLYYFICEYLLLYPLDLVCLFFLLICFL